MSKSFNNNNSSKKLKTREETIDTQVLKNSMEEFFRNSKEKILKMKDDISVLQKENKKLQNELPTLKNRQSELNIINEELNLRLVGMKEKLLAAQKIRNNLQLELKDLKQESDAADNEIETLKIILLEYHEIELFESIYRHSFNKKIGIDLLPSRIISKSFLEKEVGKISDSKKSKRSIL